MLELGKRQVRRACGEVSRKGPRGMGVGGGIGG